MTTVNPLLLLLCVFTSFNSSIAQTKRRDYWISFPDKSGNYGYKNAKGHIAIPAGKYTFCFTDTFRNYALVALPGSGFVGIDRKENILFKVFSIDSGPDYIKDGYFRILKGSKIGYANAATGKIAIPPRFACAWPFEKGVAKVALQCATQAVGEYHAWISDKWFYINKKGEKVAERWAPLLNKQLQKKAE